MWYDDLNLSTVRQRLTSLCEFDANLVYIVSFGLHSGPYLNKTKSKIGAVEMAHTS